MLSLCLRIRSSPFLRDLCRPFRCSRCAWPTTPRAPRRPRPFCSSSSSSSSSLRSLNSSSKTHRSSITSLREYSKRSQCSCRRLASRCTFRHTTIPSSETSCRRPRAAHPPLPPATCSPRPNPEATPASLLASRAGARWRTRRIRASPLARGSRGSRRPETACRCSSARSKSQRRPTCSRGDSASLGLRSMRTSINSSLCNSSRCRRLPHATGRTSSPSRRTRRRSVAAQFSLLPSFTHPISVRSQRRAVPTSPTRRGVTSVNHRPRHSRRTNLQVTASGRGPMASTCRTYPSMPSTPEVRAGVEPGETAPSAASPSATECHELHAPAAIDR
mmetsp:Transcript_27945/g.82148  ORF Transcript_27945/g.82148 Transcript_27945/m.82148 type:complete len:332 (-) Transcript_27945:331-1326(-)